MKRKNVFPMNAARICIDGRGEAVSGRVYTKLRSGPLAFPGLGEMLLWMDDMFNECGYPQAFQECRSFREQMRRPGARKVPEPQLTDEKMSRQKGKCRTFDVMIQSRRQSGWQGILMETDHTQLMHFDSEMELLDAICERLAV